MEKIIYTKNNLILNTNYKNSTTKKNDIKNIFNLFLLGNKNNKRKDNNTNNSKNNYKNKSDNKNLFFFSQRFHSPKLFRNNNKTINCLKRKDFIMNSIRIQNNKKNDLGEHSLNDNKNNSLNSDDKTEVLTNKINQDLSLKDNSVNKKKDEQNKSELNYNENIAPHNIIITDLLYQTENYFNKLGLDSNEKKNKPLQNFNYMKNYYKKKVNQNLYKLEKSKISKVPKEYNNNKNSTKYKKIKIDKKDIDTNNNDKRNKDNNFTPYKSIYDSYVEFNNNLRIKSRTNFHKTSYCKNSQSFDFNLISNNKKKNESDEKNNHEIIKNNKIFINEMIQTFSISKNFEYNKYINKRQNDLLPFLSSSMERKAPLNNRIKIAEIKQIYPTPICNVTSLKNKKKINNNIKSKILSNIKEIWLVIIILIMSRL